MVESAKSRMGGSVYRSSGKEIPVGLAEDLKALQELREKGELTERAYQSARDATMRKHSAAPSGSFQLGRFLGYVLVAVLVLIVGLYVIDAAAKHPRLFDVQHPYSAPVVPFLSPQPHSVAITNGALTVGAHAISWYTFSVPPHATNVVWRDTSQRRADSGMTSSLTSPMMTA